YGMLEGFDRDSKDPRPIVDLRPLLELPEWFHALRVFRETGSTGPLARLIGIDSGKSAGCADVDRIVRSLEELSFAYEAGMPLELADAAECVTLSFAGAAPSAATPRIPLADQVSQLLADSCQVFRTSALAQGTLSKRQAAEWKSQLAVDDEELRRQ